MATNVIIKKLASVKRKIHGVNAALKAHDVQYCGQNPILLIRTNNYTLLFSIFKNSYIPRKRLCPMNSNVLRWSPDEGLSNPVTPILCELLN